MPLIRSSICCCFHEHARNPVRCSFHRFFLLPRKPRSVNANSSPIALHAIRTSAVSSVPRKLWQDYSLSSHYYLKLWGLNLLQYSGPYRTTSSLPFGHSALSTRPELLYLSCSFMFCHFSRPLVSLPPPPPHVFVLHSHSTSFASWFGWSSRTSDARSTFSARGAPLARFFNPPPS